MNRRDLLLLCFLALLIGGVISTQLGHPGYTDAFYYFNAGKNLAVGRGLTDDALWTFIGEPATLPAPSHLYWMPMPSIIAGVSMSLWGASFKGAQVLFIPFYAGLVGLTYWLTIRLGGSRRSAWIASLCALGSGYFLPYWFTTETFSPYGLLGAGALIGIGLGRATGKVRFFGLAGTLCGLAHLTRNDGLLLIVCLMGAALWPGLPGARSRRAAFIGLAAYLLVMLPWFGRMMQVSGAILPAGGLETAWMRSYDEIANYPPEIAFSDFWAWGLDNIVRSRLEALILNGQTFLLVEGMILFAPLMLVALWQRRRDPMLSGFWLYMPALHITMTVVFPFPGTRGGLFHSAAALLPFWMALGVLGLEGVIAWAAKKRRWRANEAKLIFSSLALLWIGYLSLSVTLGKINAWGGTLYAELKLPPDAVVMVNDPSAVYYFKELGGVVLPNAAPAAIPEIARRYGVTHVVVDAGRTPPMEDLWRGVNLPNFLEPLVSTIQYRVYRIK